MVKVVFWRMCPSLSKMPYIWAELIISYKLNQHYRFPIFPTIILQVAIDSCTEEKIPSRAIPYTITEHVKQSSPFASVKVAMNYSTRHPDAVVVFLGMWTVIISVEGYKPKPGHQSVVKLSIIDRVIIAHICLESRAGTLFFIGMWTVVRRKRSRDWSL